MKLIENTLYLEFAEMVECGVSENTLLRHYDDDMVMLELKSELHKMLQP